MNRTIEMTARAPRLKAVKKDSGSIPNSMHAANPIPGEWCVGIVRQVSDGSLTVVSGGLQARASRAVSCLLDPADGDSVACLRVAPQEVWIVAVLRREEGVANILRCTGNTSIQVEGGALQIKAANLSLKSDVFDLASKHAQIGAESAEIVGKRLRVIGTTIKIVGSAMSTVMDRINQFSKHYLRNTDGMDRVSATHIEVEAQQLMRLNAQHALISGEQLVKARGAQIHFG